MTMTPDGVGPSKGGSHFRKHETRRDCKGVADVMFDLHLRLMAAARNARRFQGV